MAQEEYETALSAKLNDFKVTVTRMDAAEVAAVEKKGEEIKLWFDGLRHEK